MQDLLATSVDWTKPSDMLVSVINHATQSQKGHSLVETRLGLENTAKRRELSWVEEA
jgi:hypothetical protein